MRCMSWGENFLLDAIRYYSSLRDEASYTCECIDFEMYVHCVLRFRVPRDGYCFPMHCMRNAVAEGEAKIWVLRILSWRTSTMLMGKVWKYVYEQNRYFPIFYKNLYFSIFD